jgi:hypothetical protein
MNRSQEGADLQKNLKHFLCCPQIITGDAPQRWHIRFSATALLLFVVGVTFYAKRHLWQREADFRPGRQGAGSLSSLKTIVQPDFVQQNAKTLQFVKEIWQP